MRPVTIEDLPVEMLWEVFSYLDLEELVSACCVSSCWKQVGNGLPLMARHEYIITHESPSEIDRIFQNIPCLRKIKICYSAKKNIKSTLKSVQKFCTDLRDLYIDGNKIIDYNLLQNVLKKFPNLKSLSVPLKYSITPQFINQIGACLELQKLVLFASTYELDMKPIADGCPNLRHLDIRDCYYNYENLNYLLVQKKHLLQALLFTPIRRSQIVPSLSQCTRLKHVHCNGITPKNYAGISLGAFLDEISSLSALKRLDLIIFDNITEDELMKLSKCSFSSTLTYLHLDFDLTQEWSQTIVSCLPNVEKLVVEISVLDIERKGLKNLLEMKKLTHLGMRWWPLPGPLFETLLQCKQIKHLAIGNCSKLTDKDALRLVKEMKLRYLKIINCLGLTNGFLKSFPPCETLKELYIDLLRPREQIVRELKLRQTSTRITVQDFSDNWYVPTIGDL